MHPASFTSGAALYAIAGDPVAQVGSPALFNRLCAERGHDGVMVPLRVAGADLAAAFAGLRRVANLRGLVLTVPHKIAMAGLVDDLAPTARRVGTVNAARREADGRWRGDMFDGEGCVAAARAKGHGFKGRSALMAGAGGVGRAIAFALAGAGIARLAVFDPAPGRAAGLAARLAEAFPRVRAHAVEPGAAGGGDVLVNASPLGMAAGDPPPLPLDGAGPGTLAIDVVLADRPTPFLAAAAARGAAVQDGRAMLEAQIETIAGFFGV